MKFFLFFLLLVVTLTLQKPEGFRAKTHTETYKIRRVIPPRGGVKGVVGYREPLTTPDLKSSGFPDGPLSRGPEGQQYVKIDPIL